MAETQEKRPTVHPTHKTQEHPVRGLFCLKCKLWNGDEALLLSDICAGPREFAKLSDE